MSKLQEPSSREAPSIKVLLERSDDAWPSLEIGERDLTLSEEPGDYGPSNHPFDLEERCAKFGESVIRFCEKIPQVPGNNRIIDQLVGAATSIGANYCEANEGVSKKDFRYSISRCKKEAKESGHFLRMAAAAVPDLSGEARNLYREARELLLIFASMYRN